jgi:putative transposase
MRKPRFMEVIPGLPHHVMLRGNNKRRLFSYAPDYRRMIGYFVDALKEHPVILHALVLMANHLHALLTPATVDDLSRFVHPIAQRYAQYRNRRRGGTGKVFEERFIAIPVTNEQYLATLTGYIELNPVRAGRVDDPLGWPWSTYALHAGSAAGVPSYIWTPSDWYKSLGADRQERAAAYTQFVHEVDPRALPPEHLAEIEEVEAHSLLVGVRPDWRPNGERAA